MIELCGSTEFYHFNVVYADVGVITKSNTLSCGSIGIIESSRICSSKAIPIVTGRDFPAA